MSKVAMQIYCVHCGKEQYLPAVWEISHGKEPCCWCGEMSKEMTEKEYRNTCPRFKKLGGKK